MLSTLKSKFIIITFARTLYSCFFLKVGSYDQNVMNLGVKFPSESNVAEFHSCMCASIDRDLPKYFYLFYLLVTPLVRKEF